MISVQFVSLFVMFVSGLIVGSVIDFVRIQTEKLPYRYIKVIRFLCEIISWIALGFLSFYFLYVVKDGQWRAIDVIAQVLGIIMYDKFFYRVIRLLGRLFMNLIINPIIAMIRLIALILKKIVMLFIKLMKFIILPFHLFIKNIRKIF